MSKTAKAKLPGKLRVQNDMNWRSSEFWRNLFLYFWVFSFIGHIVELVWGLFEVAIGTRSWPSYQTIPLVAVAVPYGLGAVALRLIIYPLVRAKRVGLVATFLSGAIVTTTVEFICATLVVLFTGHNYFWNYSDRFANLFGYVCLENAILFGIGATIALKWVFPYTEKLLKTVPRRWLNITFWILFIGYILSQIYLRLIRGQ
jgi:uncharacterized membrane protein